MLRAITGMHTLNKLLNDLNMSYIKCFSQLSGRQQVYAGVISAAIVSIVQY